jgi:phospholipase D-like protein
MLRLIPVVLILGFALLALIDLLSRDDDDIRGLPKIVWAFVILLFPLLGSLAWFFAGRPRQPSGSPLWRPGGGFPESARRRPVAPDDDPEFLRRLGERSRRPDDEGRERRTDGQSS